MTSGSDTAPVNKSAEARGWRATPIAVVLAAGVLSAIEASRLGGGASLARTWPDFVVVATIAAIVILFVTLVVARLVDRERGRRLATFPRATLAVMMTIPVAWVANELGQGKGIERAGLTAVVRWGFPVVVGMVFFVTAGPIVALLRRPVTRLVVAAVACVAGFIFNARVFPGLYVSTHDAVFCLSVIALVVALSGFVRMVGLARRSPIGVFAAIAIIGGIAFAVMKSPTESTRSSWGRDGLHAARLLRWRRRFLPTDDASTLPFRDDLVASLAAWNDVARRASDDLGQRRPDRETWNLVWITVDTLRADRLGCARDDVDSTDSLTPRLDAFARDATVFRRAYAQYPSTHLSGESMFFGRYPTATTLFRSSKGIDVGKPSRAWPEHLRTQGFATAAAIAFDDEWLAHPALARVLGGFDLVNPDRPGGDDGDGRHFIASAKSALDRIGDRRFFLWLHLFDPHHPYRYREGLTRGTGAEARYDGEVRYTDALIGTFFDDLAMRGLTHRTVVAVTADHGEAFGENGVRYHGSSLYEEQVRVPMIVRVPGGGGRVVDEPVEVVDLVETSTDALGLTDRMTTQGTSLLPLVLGGPDLERYPAFAYAELPDDVKELSAGSANVDMFVADGWKLLSHRRDGYVELYHLDEDPGENVDRARAEPEVRRDMESRLMTMHRLSRDFERTLDEDVAVVDRRAEIEAGLADENPFKRMAALVDARRHGVRDVASLIMAHAVNPDELAEVRFEASEALFEWETPDTAAVWRRFQQSDDPVLVWQALRRGPRDLDHVPEPPSSSIVNDGPLETARRLARLRRGEGFGRRELTLTARAPTVAATLRVRILRGLATKIGSDDEAWEFLADLDHASDLGWNVADELALLNHLATVAPAAWLDRVGEIVGDRYLTPAIKNHVLERVTSDAAVDPRIGRAFAMQLLAGWDPAFHDRAMKRIAERYGVATRDALLAAKSLEGDAIDLVKSESWGRALAAWQATLRTLPSETDRLRLEAWAMIAAAKADKADVLSLFVERDRFDEFAGRRRLARRIEDVATYDPRQGPMSERDPVRVLYVSVEETSSLSSSSPRSRADGSRPQYRSASSVPMTVRMRNDADRTLPGGDWPEAGRLRVIWTRLDDGGAVSRDEKTIYGDIHDLRHGLRSGEARTVRMTPTAPSEAGRWRGRVIVYQHPEVRFHFAETDAATFEIDVVADDFERFRPQSWTARQIVRAWTIEEGIHDFGVGPDTNADVAQGVVSRYLASIISPPIRLDGRKRRMTVRMTWRSSQPVGILEARLMSVVDGAEITKERSQGRLDGDDPGEQTIVIDLPTYDGVARLKVALGMRAGVIGVRSVHVE